MRIAIGIATAVLASAFVWSVARAEPTATHNPAAPSVTVQDCRKAGNEVSALIDNRPTSPNLPAARAVFQVGIMECMEGDDVAANTHYEEAKALLDGRQAPISTPPVRN